MNQQTELVFVKGSETSRAAARMMQRTGKAEMDRVEVLAYIRSAGAKGRTDREMQDALEMSGDSQRPRRNELAGNGRISRTHPFWPVLIHKQDKRNGCVVWVVVSP